VYVGLDDNDVVGQLARKKFFTDGGRSMLCSFFTMGCLSAISRAGAQRGFGARGSSLRGNDVSRILVHA
jgi:hypothetical protein